MAQVSLIIMTELYVSNHIGCVAQDTFMFFITSIGIIEAYGSFETLVHLDNNDINHHRIM